MLYFRGVAALCCSYLLASNIFGAEIANARTQTIQLQRGWNAVFLEVYPSEPEPSAVFAGKPIDIVASFFAPSSPAQFVSDPGTELFKKAGWGVWYSEKRPDAFLKSLHAIHGQQAYLVHATSDCAWTVTGTVVMPDVHWQSDSYNFVGFSVHPVAPPTFAQFFEGSKAHRNSKVYRLLNGTWRRVPDLSAETMRAGEAYWIYCDGASAYQGPLRVETTTHYGLLLETDTDSIKLFNETSHPVAPTLEHVVSGTNALPLAIVLQVVSSSNASIQTVSTPMPDGAWTQLIPPLDGGMSLRVPFQLRQRDTQFSFQGSLLKITTDLGTEIWIPVTGLRTGLPEN